MTGRIFRYVVRYDAGSAPNPSAGWCSLAICKPRIRRHAQVGDWIIGQRSQTADRIVYVMQVERKLGFAEYWNDPDFRSRRPNHCRRPDNIYRPTKDGGLEWVSNPVHEATAEPKDTGGLFVLVSRRFWYFGDSSPPLAPELSHLLHRGQGHSLHVRRKADDLDRLQQWLGHWSIGVHGRPIDLPVESGPPRCRSTEESKCR